VSASFLLPTLRRGQQLESKRMTIRSLIGQGMHGYVFTGGTEDSQIRAADSPADTLIEHILENNSWASLLPLHYRQIYINK
jgi:hypothetical protein